MALQITFNDKVDNTSLQIGDIAYYVKDDDTSTSITSFTDSITYIGEITNVKNDYIIIDSPSVTPPDDAFIMFSKNKIVNNTSLLGYFAEVTLSNNSTEKAELFSLGSEITLSSK
jgi:hypothetical protein